MLGTTGEIVSQPPIKRQHVNPETIAKPQVNYSHVVTVEGGRLIFLAGQVPLAPDGAVVGKGNIGEQARQCFKNIRAGLEAVGARPSDIVKLTTFVVGYDPSYRTPIFQARDEVLDFEHAPASTLLGVESLASNDFLIEVEAIAVAPFA